MVKILSSATMFFTSNFCKLHRMSPSQKKTVPPFSFFFRFCRYAHLLKSGSTSDTENIVFEFETKAANYVFAFI